jgi:uncharacterized glyoxalase superfamily protein PhnB
MLVKTVLRSPSREPESGGTFSPSIERSGATREVRLHPHDHRRSSSGSPVLRTGHRGLRGLAGPVFAELRLPSCTIAFGQSQTAQLFNNAARPADNHSLIIEFQVDDVDKEYERLKTLVSEWVQEPTTMPWGNRSVLFRDPDGNLVNLFTPVTEEAIKRFSSD